MRVEYRESTQLKFSVYLYQSSLLQCTNILHFTLMQIFFLLLYLRCLRWCLQPVQLCQHQQTTCLPTKEFPEHEKACKGRFYSGTEPRSGLCWGWGRWSTGKSASLNSSDKQAEADLDLSFPLHARLKGASRGTDLCAHHMSLISSVSERARGSSWGW